MFHDILHVMYILKLLLFIISALILLSSCANTESVTNMNSPLQQQSIIPSTTEADLQGLQPPDNLKRDCEPKIAETRDAYNNEGLMVGTNAIDFTLKDTAGNEVTLSELTVDKPVVMILGSFT